ncbi:hypothetical protein KM472_gp251 [Cynomolgus macaque cytomegalovirus strain Ottawa]|uniref:Uncharacterized protein n=1 Tax=macacine betaherpesvirus 8 TaxID=2560567 RepID=G8H0Y0_9BETA|nr:hypothetical protein KM472_gp251 [Cynomolgus macaque cytomegalovirus strain Ottawa]AEQ32328.1 hypothetical protein cy239 [Cynomolgus macaque cytomegalovirus strain Ottawa]
MYKPVTRYAEAQHMIDALAYPDANRVNVRLSEKQVLEIGHYAKIRIVSSVTVREIVRASEARSSIFPPGAPHGDNGPAFVQIGTNSLDPVKLLKGKGSVYVTSRD